MGCKGIDALGFVIVPVEDGHEDNRPSDFHRAQPAFSDFIESDVIDLAVSMVSDRHPSYVYVEVRNLADECEALSGVREDANLVCRAAGRAARKLNRNQSAW